MSFHKIARHCKTIAGPQTRPFFRLKLHKPDRPADKYVEQKILDEPDEHGFYEDPG